MLLIITTVSTLPLFPAGTSLISHKHAKCKFHYRGFFFMSNASTRRGRAPASLLAVLLPLVVILIPRHIHAQPSPTYAMSSVLAGTNFYVIGGKKPLVGNASTGQDQTIAQTFALDLSTSWPTASPPWKDLNSRYGFSGGFATSMPDNKTLLLFNTNSSSIALFNYNVQSNSWGDQIVVPSGIFAQFSPTPVTDPRTGLTYLATDSVGRVMNVYNHASNNWSPSQIPSNMLLEQYGAGAVYNSARRSIMYLGGFSNAAGAVWNTRTYVTEYSIDSQGWTIYVTSHSLERP
jgi:hypothetical protein